MKTGYWLSLGRNNISAPTDGQVTYLWSSANTNSSQCRVQIPIAGVIKKGRITARTAGVGSNELSSAYLNLNGGSNQNIISSTIDCSVENSSQVVDMNIPVLITDYINVQITFATFVTNPTNVVVVGSVRIETA